MKKINLDNKGSISLRDLIETYQYNFDYLLSLIQNIDLSDVALKKDIKTKFDITSIDGLSDKIKKLEASIEEKDNQIKELTDKLQQTHSISLESQRVVLEVNKLLTQKI